MAVVGDSIWGVDIGSNSVKALRVRLVEEGVEVIGFDSIEHAKVLTSPGVSKEEREELMAASLRELAERNDFSKDEVVISVPGHSSFARFIKLPPVEPKGIPKIIQYEAVQQIPFDINEVEWDWQVMETTGSREIEAGIFAIKNELVMRQLEHFGREDMKVTCVQMAPMALYNYAWYDRKDLGDSGRGGVIVIDMGAENTDLVICTRTGVWQRSIPLGGNAFTRAIAEAFKLRFAKAEKLKRTAPMSKYARQILQAMKPVFADLATEVQRSLGFYTSSNRQIKLLKVVALGGGMKLQGLTKFLQQTLQLPVVRPDSFDKLKVGRSISAAKFHENVCDFGIVYGLVLQGLGLGKIESNLLPRKIARAMIWAGKGKYFLAAACMFVAVCFLCFARASYDKSKYRNNVGLRDNYKMILNDARQAGKKLEEEKSKEAALAAEIEKRMGLFKHRDTIALLNQTLISCLPNARNNPEQAGLYEAFSKNDVAGVLSYPRKERKQLFVTSVSISYADDLAFAEFGQRVGRTRTRTRTRTGSFRMPAGGGIDMMEMMWMMQMGGQMPGMKGQGGARPRRRTEQTSGEQSEGEEKAGFVVVLEGYSPYRNIMDLLDPEAVGSDRSKWGIVTRFKKLKEIFPESGFELYSTDYDHLRIKKDTVDLESVEMPDGIGEEQERAVGSQAESRQEARTSPWSVVSGIRGRDEYETVLIDPMTKEVVSKVVERDEKGKPRYNSSNEIMHQVNDYWFSVRAKFVCKEAPDEARVEKSSAHWEDDL